MTPTAPQPGILVIEPVETRDYLGNLQGRWVLTVHSTVKYPKRMPLCTCARGHATRRESMWCDEARDLAKRLWTEEDLDKFLDEMAAASKKEAEVTHAV